MNDSDGLRAHLPTLCVVTGGVFIALINSTTSAASLPEIGKDLAVSDSVLPWLITSYAIALATGAIAFGRIADIFGLRPSYLWGLGVFAVASFGIGLVQSFPLLLLLRVIQGFFGSAIASLSGAVVARRLPESVRSYGFGMLVGAMGLGLGLGPLAGAAATDLASWRLSFIGTAALASLLFVPAVALIPNIPGRPKQKFDAVGAVLMGGAIGTLFTAISEIPLDPDGVVGLFSLGLVVPFSAGFLVWIHRIQRALVPPILFQNVPFLAVSAIAISVNAALLGSIYVISNLLTQQLDVSATSTGLYLLPGALAMGFLGLVGGRLSLAVGDRSILVGGVLLLLFGLSLLALGVGLNARAVAAIYVLIGAGYGLSVPALPNTASRFLPVNDVATGFGIFNFAVFLGGPLAVALGSIVLENRDGVGDSWIVPYGGSAAAHSEAVVVTLLLAIPALPLALKYCPRRESMLS
jgi:DHA2 family metal-tetracycline-proton antiporter-like MFS transporter